MTRFAITDEHVQRAFNTLQSSDHAAARAAYEFAEKHLKVILAQQAGASNASSVAQRDNEALRSDAYDQALINFKLVAETYHKAKDRKDAALAVIDGWRTQQSDHRAMGRVG